MLKIGQFPNTFILSFDFNEDEDLDEKSLDLIVTNGFDKLYRIDLSYGFMASHRTKVGIEGTW